MMPKIKRKRLIVLALLAFFCCGAVIGVDWRRLGGGFLAFLKGRQDPVVVLGGRSPADGSAVAANRNPAPRATGPKLATASAHRHAHGADDASGGHGKPDDDDLFKYGLPAAGGISPGSFVVAQNDTPAGGNPGNPTLPAIVTVSDAGGPAPTGGDVTSPAPGPLVGPSDAGLTGGKTTPTPAPSPVSSTPAPAPGQPGGPDQGPGDVGSTPPPPSSAPVSTVPENSPLAMMGLGALFIAVAAARRRRA